MDASDKEFKNEIFKYITDEIKSVITKTFNTTVKTIDYNPYYNRIGFYYNNHTFVVDCNMIILNNSDKRVYNINDIEIYVSVEPRYIDNIYTFYLFEEVPLHMQKCACVLEYSVALYDNEFMGKIINFITTYKV